MLVASFPNLSTLSNICPEIPVSTASVQRNFAERKIIETRLRNCFGESSLNYLMVITAESPEKFTDVELV